MVSLSFQLLSSKISFGDGGSPTAILYFVLYWPIFRDPHRTQQIHNRLRPAAAALLKPWAIPSELEADELASSVSSLLCFSAWFRYPNLSYPTTEKTEASHFIFSSIRFRRIRPATRDWNLILSSACQLQLEWSRLLFGIFQDLAGLDPSRIWPPNQEPPSHYLLLSHFSPDFFSSILPWLWSPPPDLFISSWPTRTCRVYCFSNTWYRHLFFPVCVW